MRKEYISDITPTLPGGCASIAMFDKGAASKLSTGGFICLDRNREYLSCIALWYGARSLTNYTI